MKNTFKKIVVVLCTIFCLMPLLVKAEDKFFVIPALTEEDYRTNGIEYDPSQRYVYGLEISSLLNKGERIKPTEINIYSSTGHIITQANDVDGHLVVNNLGAAYAFLYTDEEYFLKQVYSEEDSSVYITTGKIDFDFSNMTILPEKDFRDRNIKRYGKAIIQNTYTNNEIDIQNKITEKNYVIEEWEKQQCGIVEQIYSKYISGPYNNKQKRQMKAIYEVELGNVRNLSEKYKQDYKESIRKGEDIDLFYSPNSFEKSLENITPHFFHWACCAMMIISLLLHFIFNKHLAVDALIIIPIIFLCLDFCNLSIIFTGITLLLDIICTILGFKFDNDVEEVEEVFKNVR